MRTVCSYCRQEGDPKPPLEDDQISHTMCKECFAYYSYQWADAPLDEFLNWFDGPVMLMGSDGRVAGVNEQAEQALGKVRRDALGLLSGEVMECDNARLQGGCGKTMHCAMCTIRRTVMHTMETGEPAKRVPAFLSQKDQTLKLLISAEKKGKVVIVMVEEMEVVTDSDEQGLGARKSA